MADVPLRGLLQNWLDSGSVEDNSLISEVCERLGLAITAVSDAGVITFAVAPGLAASGLTGTIASAVQDNITRTGTLVSGATGSGFTLALAASTISGDLPDANLSANVPLLNAANAFTAANTFSATGGVTLGASGAANGFLLAPESMYFHIDSDNSQADRVFGWFANAAVAGTGTELMMLTEAGLLKLSAYTSATWVAGDVYLVVDASGNVHRSAVGPAS